MVRWGHLLARARDVPLVVLRVEEGPAKAPVEVDLATGRVSVEGEADAGALAEAIEKQGFTVETPAI